MGQTKWAVVPVDPTTGMLVAGNHCQPGNYSAALVWASMIGAAARSTELSYMRPLPQDWQWIPASQGERLCAALKAIRDHWREFGPEYGFDETLEMSCRVLDA